MNAQLHYTIAQYRGAEMRRAGERARLAAKVPAKGRTARQRRFGLDRFTA